MSHLDVDRISYLALLGAEMLEAAVRLLWSPLIAALSYYSLVIYDLAISGVK